ncbi:unknown [Clostridium sp. CAG:967]|nr:unknown [Clostridium sp. CAG:967]
MVSINIGAGQGVTQAIRDAIGAKNIKNKDLSSWQKVMAEVNNAQNKIDQHNASNPDDKQKSIFTGGNNVNEIGDKTKYTKNFVVQQGTIEIDDSTWSKIVQLLTGKAPEVKPQEDPKEPPAPLDGKPQKLGGGAASTEILDKIDTPSGASRATTESMVDKLGGKIIERSVNGEKQDIAVVEINGQKIRRAINEDGSLGDNLAATKTFGKNKYISGEFPAETKVFEREVNGKKQQIGIYEDENGNKVRKLVVTDEQTGKTTLGENLVTVSTMGKNKYVTESKFNSDVRAMLGLGADDEIPADLKAEYVTIGGESSIVFKKDGKTMDNSQIKAYMAEYKANDTKLAEDFDNSFNTSGQAEIGDAAKLAKSQVTLINNKYGDKQGNITSDEYFNYQLAEQEKAAGRAFTDDEKANFRTMTDLVFQTLDSDQSKDITEQELTDYINNANENNDNTLTKDEVSQYTERKVTELQTKNVNAAKEAGYTTTNIETEEFGQIPVFQKDGKTYTLNMDGTVGDEILTDELKHDEAKVEENPEQVKQQNGKDKEYLPGDIRSLSPKDRTNAAINLLKSGKIKEGAFVQIGGKLVTMEDGKFVTYDKGKINRQEISEKDLRKLGEE